HWAAWPAFHSFFREVCNLKLEGDLWDRARAYEETVETAGYWWPNRDFVMVSERPTHIHRDDRGRLHAENGTAIGWPDGWGLYSWHGVQVPARVIDQPQTLTVREIAAESNVEVRRVMIERFGPSKFVQHGTQIASDDFGKLWRLDLPNDEPLVMVEVVNSTPEPDGSFKDYFLRVPPNMETPRQAVAWTFDVRKDRYEPAVQT
ncbi:MAG: DUF6745 domain-containing protein, partial [Actinomycetota bacterium]